MESKEIITELDKTSFCTVCGCYARNGLSDGVCQDCWQIGEIMAEAERFKSQQDWQTGEEDTENGRS